MKDEVKYWRKYEHFFPIKFARIINVGLGKLQGEGCELRESCSY